VDVALFLGVALVLGAGVAAILRHAEKKGKEASARGDSFGAAGWGIFGVLLGGLALAFAAVMVKAAA
jgi:hypothetical protein